jgi:UDP-2,3-diacylglucosamine hydrolase
VTALFISDLHLSATRPAVATLFKRFLAGPAREVQSLYILGDLFEYWAGDDHLSDPFNASLAAALDACVSAGTRIFFMHGNRDFLVGDEFARAAQLTLIDDPWRVTLDDGPAILSHGDLLCTSDAEYLAFRARVRTSTWSREFLAKPLTERIHQIETMRAQSEAGKRVKPMEIMDVTPAAVQAFFLDHGCDRLIHGHTHRPAHHVYHIGDRKCERWVLADWYESGSYLKSGHAGLLPLPYNEMN